MKILFQAVWCGVLVVAFAAVAKSSRGDFLARQKFLEAPPLVELDPRLVNIVTLGHKGLFDDFLHLWMLQLLVDKRLYQEQPEDIFYVVDKVLNHHPGIETLYMISCFTMLDLKRADLCEPIARRGIEAVPHSWRIPMTQGYVAALRLKDHVKGSFYYHLASSRPNAPAFIGRYAEKLSRSVALDETEVRKTLEELLQVREGSNFLRFIEKTQKAKSE